MKKIIFMIIIVVLVLVAGVTVYILPVKEVALNKPLTIHTNYTYKIKDKYFKVISIKDIGKCPKDAQCIWSGEKVYQLLVIDEGINIKEVSTVTNRNTNTKSLDLSLDKNNKLIIKQK